MPKLKRIILKFFRLALAVFVLSALATIALYNLNFGRHGSPGRVNIMREHRLTYFYSGENRLTAYIFGEDNSQGLIVISHGLGGGGLSYMREISYFLENGFRVFTFDKTGSHNSEGRSTRGLPQSAIDLNAALNYIAAEGWDIPVMLYGHSWGGFAVCAVLNFGHEIAAVVSLAGFAEPLMMLQEGAGLMLGPVGGLFRPFLWSYQRLLFGEYANLSALEGINSSDVPVKIIHGTADYVISYDGSGIIAHRNRITNPNASFVLRAYPDRSGHNDLTLDALLLTEISNFFISHLD